jgi:hypothetical protein
MVARRSILRGGIATAIAAPLTGALVYGSGRADAEDGKPVPETLALRRAEVRTGSQTPAAAFPLTHLGLAFAGAGAAAIRTRTGSGWSAWREANLCAAAHDSRPRRGALIAAPGAVEYEVQVNGGGTAAVLEINTVDGPTRTTAAPESTLPPAASADARRLPRPPYLSRAGWGADEAFRLNPDGTLDSPPTFFPVQALTVHHTGFDDDQPDPAATIRAIYYAQAVENDWGDVGYQLFIDDTGRLYEGTYSDPDIVPVFGPTLVDGRPQMVNGSHVGGFNAGNIGVCLIGDLTARQPTAAARRTLTVVLAILSAVCRLDPTGTTNYANPVNGKLATLDTISGHRDWNTANPDAGPTECPGEAFYPNLPAVRDDVRALLAGVGITP